MTSTSSHFTAEHFLPFDLPPDAVRWLLDLWHVIQVWDDVADDDVVARADLDRAIFASLVTLPANPFYLTHAQALAPMLAGLVLKWKAADDAEILGMADERSFMWRAGYYDVILTIVMLVHGGTKAMSVARHIMQLYGEPFAEYRKEFPCPTP